MTLLQDIADALGLVALFAVMVALAFVFEPHQKPGNSVGDMNPSIHATDMADTREGHK